MGVGSTFVQVDSSRIMSRPHTRGCAKSLGELTWLLSADLFRYAGNRRFFSFLKHFLFTPGYKYTVWMRTCGYLKVKWWARALLLYPFFKWMLLRVRYKYGIAIPEYTSIGPGLFINRFGGVMVNGDVVIGANCNITHGAMIGQSNRGDRAGSPVVGDRVFFAAGCKVIGAISIGDDAVIGANAVVTRDVAPMAVMGGIPAKVISMEGSRGYINKAVKLKGRRRRA